VKVKVTEGNKMYISIKDEGSGIDGEDLLNLGEPFYTTKKDGTGLGLMVTNQIVKDHKGDISFGSNQINGTKVTVILPISQIN
jgi:signal transduction histidine kinase